MSLAPRFLTPRLAMAGAVLALIGASTRSADAYERSLKYVTTGNGFGFQVWDVDQKKIVEFLEHPYRYVRPQPGQPVGPEGVGRRNLAYDVYFGLRGQWLNQVAGVPDYVDQSNIIHVPANAGGQTVDTYFFAPFGYDGNAMIAVMKANPGTDGFLLLNFHMGSGQPNPNADGESLSALGEADAVQETGPGGGAMVYVSLTGLDHADCSGAYSKVQGGQDLGDNKNCSGSDQTIALQRKLDDGWWAVGVQFVENAGDANSAAQGLKAWAGGKTGEQILQAARDEFEAWRVPPPAEVQFKTEDERKTWRQSEAVLRMGQVREPYTDTRKNNGMMLASLPHGEWHSGWVRDGLYATVGLARSGHAKEAKASLDFLIDADPVGAYTGELNKIIDSTGGPHIDDYRISVVRYYGTGEEEADFSGQPTPNVETDGWGLAMWGARQYVDYSGDVEWLNQPTKLNPSKTVYQVLAEEVAYPLELYLEPNSGIVRKESSIWEVHQQAARHFAYTTLTAARGFCDMAALAARVGKTEDQAKYLALHKKVVGGFAQSFVQNDAIIGSIEGLALGKKADAAVAEVFTWNILTDYSNKLAVGTLNLLETLRLQSGGYKRNDENGSSYDNHEWILIDLRMSNALRRSGKADRADQILDMITGKAAVNFHLLPELYSAVQSEATVGNYWGSIPMVGYGGGAYIMTLLDRANLIEPFDCGDKPPPPVDGGAGGSGPGQGGSGPGQGGSGPGQGGAGPGQGGSAGCTDLLGCGANSSSADEEIPRKGACLCRAGETSADQSWLALALVPLAAAVRKLRRRK